MNWSHARIWQPSDDRVFMCHPLLARSCLVVGTLTRVSCVPVVLFNSSDVAWSGALGWRHRNGVSCLMAQSSALQRQYSHGRGVLPCWMIAIDALFSYCDELQVDMCPPSAYTSVSVNIVRCLPPSHLTTLNVYYSSLVALC